jgi:hypothetical protein
MPSKFDTTMTESDFVRPLLDANEERLAREIYAEPDLRVDGLTGSLIGRLLNLLAGTR